MYSPTRCGRRPPKLAQAASLSHLKRPCTSLRLECSSRCNALPNILSLQRSSYAGRRSSNRLLSAAQYRSLCADPAGTYLCIPDMCRWRGCSAAWALPTGRCRNRDLNIYRSAHLDLHSDQYVPMKSRDPLRSCCSAAVNFIGGAPLAMTDAG